MGSKDDGVTALQDSRPVAGRRCRGIRHRGERPDDPYRLGVFRQPPGFIPLDHPHRFGMFDIPADPQDLDLMFGEFVLIDTHAGLFHSDLRAGGDIVVPVDLPGRREGHLVDLLLGIIFHLFLCGAGLGHQSADNLFVAQHIHLLFPAACWRPAGCICIQNYCGCQPISLATNCLK